MVRGEACIPQQPQGFRKLGKLPGRGKNKRSMTFHAFVFGSLKLDFSYYGDLFLT